MTGEIFPQINRGNRLGSYLNLQMDPDKPFRYAPDYSYVEIPFGDAISLSTGELIEEPKLIRNQRIRIRPACKINLRGPWRLLVKVNPMLHDFGITPELRLIDPVNVGTSDQPVFNITLQRDLDLTKLEWCVRLYFIG